MIFDLKQLESISYKVENDRIKFYNDFSNKLTRDKYYKNGYLTIWAYYIAEKRGFIDKSTRDDKLFLLIKCAQFSYTEIMKSFDLIVGVTSGLTSLNKTEKHYLQEILKIKNYTVVPSMYPE